MSDRELRQARIRAEESGLREDLVRARVLEIRSGACEHELEWERLFDSSIAGDQKIEARCALCPLGVVVVFNPLHHGIMAGTACVAKVWVDEVGDAVILITDCNGLDVVYRATWPLGEYEEEAKDPPPDPTPWPPPTISRPW